jgi:hypothetical protein
MGSHSPARRRRSTATRQLRGRRDGWVALDGMGRNDNPWEQVATLAGIAALAGAGVGAGSALVFAERRAGAQDRELESLAHRVTMLERLSERVTRLERGSRSPGPRADAP